MSHYDAATPPQAAPTLEDLVARSESSELTRLLDEVVGLTTEIHEQLAAEPLSPGEISALEAVTGDPEAPLEFHSLHRRVHDGLLTWERFWAAPSAEGPVGQQVVVAVLDHLTSEQADAATGRRDG